MAVQQHQQQVVDHQHKWRERCCGNWGFWVDVLMCMGLVLFAGMLSGLTLGLMSLSLLDLQLLLKSTPQNRIYAGTIYLLFMQNIYLSFFPKKIQPCIDIKLYAKGYTHLYKDNLL
jgi:hypothetical protein